MGYDGPYNSSAHVREHLIEGMTKTGKYSFINFSRNWTLFEIKETGKRLLILSINRHSKGRVFTKTVSHNEGPYVCPPQGLFKEFMKKPDLSGYAKTFIQMCCSSYNEKQRKYRMTIDKRRKV